MSNLILTTLILASWSAVGANLLPVELNRCKTQSEKGKSEEVFAREAAEAANLSDHEVFGRLLLAEAAASGYLSKRCSAPNMQTMMEAFGWVVINRVHKLSPDKDDPKPDAFYNVIFEPRQFRTSFSAHGNNPYAKIFLCPMEVKTFLQEAGTGVEAALSSYKQAKEVAARIMEIYQKSGIPTEYARINHYFLPQADVLNAQRPKWAKDADPTKNKGYVDLLKMVSKPCAEFYRIK